MDHGIRLCDFYLLVKWHRQFLGSYSIGSLETGTNFDVHSILCWLIEYYLRRCVLSAQRALHEADRSEMGWPYWDSNARPRGVDLGLHDLECRWAFRDDWNVVWDWEQFVLCEFILSLISRLFDFVALLAPTQGFKELRTAES